MKMSERQMPNRLQAELEDLLGCLHFARREEDLGRLALLTYWEVRRWARVARHELLAEHSAQVITAHPHPSRGAFLALVDGVIAELEDIRRALH
ncbi:MAG: hypothetical protein KF788_20915 [Piscinibacter sp.]|nr:hypothetical protein [Piscinibacter sp.]